ADGSYSFTAQASDAAGNTGAASSAYAVTVDSHAPGAPAITNTDAYDQDGELTLAITAEHGSGVERIQHGVPIGLATESTTTPGLSLHAAPPMFADGSYSFTAQASDAAGNTGAASSAYAVTVDSHAPGAPAITNTDAYDQDGELTLAITAEHG